MGFTSSNNWENCILLLHCLKGYLYLSEAKGHTSLNHNEICHIPYDSRTGPRNLYIISLVPTQLNFAFQNSVNVDEAAKPHSDACFAVRFLADAGVLYEIICYGLSSADKEVCRQG